MGVFPLEKIQPVKCVRISRDHDVGGGLCVFLEIKLV